jgi:hypothetical protein
MRYQVVPQEIMNEAISAPDFIQDDASVSIVEEAYKIEGEYVTAPEQNAQYPMPPPSKSSSQEKDC